MPKSTPTTTNTHRYAYPPEMAQAFAELAQVQARLAAQQAATEAQLRLTSQEQALTSKEVRALNDSIKRMGEHLGSMANNQGLVAEDFFYNSLLEHPQVGSFKFTKIVRNSVVGYILLQRKGGLLVSYTQGLRAQ